MKIIVIGAGVSGLSSAILLLKAGHDVSIWAKDVSPNTTSDVAAAFWSPFKSEPKDKVLVWAKQTYEYAKKNLISTPKSGCIERKLFQISKSKISDPWWRDIVPDFEHSIASLPAGYVDSFVFTTIVFDTFIYMDFLSEEFEELGGEIVNKKIESLTEPLEDVDVVINCAGFGSADLLSDKQLTPSRGQVVIVKSNGFERVVLDPKNLILVVPRVNDIVLGATVDDGDSNLKIEASDTNAILGRVRDTFPDYDWSNVIGEKVGLRPVRTSVRLEKELINGKPVIHNYGHGGSGFTLSWGCANEVVDLVKQDTR